MRGDLPPRIHGLARLLTFSSSDTVQGLVFVTLTLEIRYPDIS